MSVISKFEGIMEGVVEGSFSRLFRNRLQPAEIEKKLERAMEDYREVALGKSFVPNRYEVYLNPEDFSQFAPHKANLEKEMSNHLKEYGWQRHFSFSGGSPRVWITPSEQVKRRTFHIKAYTFDPNQSSPQTSAPVSPLNNEVPENFLEEGTAILNVGAISLTGQQKAVAGSPAFSRPEATLTVLEYPTSHPGKNVRFNRDVTIGRGLDNDIVFENEARVSRHHARIDFKYGQFLLSDTGSTNGTKVNGQPVTQIVLAPGDRISLGGLEVLFQV